MSFLLLSLISFATIKYPSGDTLAPAIPSIRLPNGIFLSNDLVALFGLTGLLKRVRYKSVDPAAGRLSNHQIAIAQRWWNF